MTARLTFWFDSTQPDPHKAAILRRWYANLPSRRQCAYCSKRATRADGCCGECTAVEHAIPARFDERYDPSPEPIDRRTR